MQRRSISLAEIEEALEQCHTTYESQDDPAVTVRLGDLATGRRLKVVVRTADHSFVITVADRDDPV